VRERLEQNKSREREASMGNRAVITTEEKRIGVYLHWNGGRDSVEAFLHYCELKGYRSPSQDCYGWARLCQVIGNYFGGTLSIGIDEYSRLDTDNWDNGVYIIGGESGWEIVGRLYSHGEQMNYDHDEMLRAIDAAQPKSEQLGAYLDSIEIATKDVVLGDMVYFCSYEGIPEPRDIIGFGSKGSRYEGIPYTDLYGDAERGYEWNCNNFVHGETCRIVPRKTLEELEQGVAKALSLLAE